MRFAAPSPLEMFLSRATPQSPTSAPLRAVEKKAAWLFGDSDDDFGLAREDSLGRDFRRFEGGGLFNTLGQEKETAQKGVAGLPHDARVGMREEGYAHRALVRIKRNSAGLEGNLRRSGAPSSRTASTSSRRRRCCRRRSTAGK